MKKKIYLPIYKELVKKGGMSKEFGLCGEFVHRGMTAEKRMLNDLFWPPQEIDFLISHFHWGSGDFNSPRAGQFTPMRQNILLLMAAIAGEL